MFFADTDRQSIVDAASKSPYEPSNIGFIDATVRSFSDTMRTKSSMAERLNSTDAWENELQRFKDATGRAVTYPQSPAPGRGQGYAIPYGNFRAEVDAWNSANPDKKFDLPTNQDMWKRTKAFHKSAESDMAAVEDAPGFGTAAGAMAGGMGAMTAEPMNIPAFAMLGAPVGASLLRQALQDSAAAMIGQAGVELSNWSYNKRIDPNHGLGDAASSVFETGLSTGEFVVGIGAASAAVKWAANPLMKRWRERQRDPNAVIDRDTMDAGHVTEFNENLQGSNPFPQNGASGAMAHADAMVESYRAAAAGERPKLSPDVERMANETPAQAIDGRVRNAHPDEVRRLDELTDTVTTNKRSLDEIARELSDREKFSPVRKAFTEAEQLAQKIEQLQQSLAKTASEKNKAQIQIRIDKLNGEIEAKLGSVDRETLARLDELEAAKAARSGANAAAEKELEAQKATVERLRAEQEKLYWEDAKADAGMVSSFPPSVQEVTRQIRADVNGGKLPVGQDLVKDLNTAYGVMEAAAREGKHLNEFLADVDHADGVNGRVRALINLMHTGADLSTRITDDEFAGLLRQLGADTKPAPVRMAEAAQPVLFGDALKPEDILRSRIAAERQKLAELMTPEQLQKAAESPVGREAAVMDAYRLIEERGDIEIPMLDASGNMTKRKLSDILDEADAEILASKELHNCAIGREAAE